MAPLILYNVATKSKEELLLERLGKRLRTLRKQRGWTLEDTEARGWPSWRHLQRIESGKNITVLTLIAACKMYGVKASKLLEDVE